jgi:trans-2,3-dihydro-3-hydroxyanthranilate isomerase
MSTRRFLMLDVFAEQKLAGNQLAVVRDSDGLDGATMQRIAREMHFSETTFLLSDRERDGGFDVRIFTPEAEVPFAGHPTLGTAFAIRETLLGGEAEQVVLNLQVGQIPVTFESGPDTGGLAWMRQRSPEFMETLDRETAARLLSLTPEDVDERAPAQQVSTGLPFTIVPLRSLDAVRRARLDPTILEGLTLAKSIFLFCPEAVEPENQIHARMFAPTFGVPEDPATGSANGCLAAYLVQYRYFDSDSVEVRVEQGHEMNRPSRLYLRAAKGGGDIEVHVGGKVFLVARGELL